jgi:hypothetical protein
LEEASIGDAKYFDLPIDMKTSFIGVTSTSFLSYVHRSKGKTRTLKSLEKQEKALREYGLVEVDEYVEVVFEEEGIPPTFE